MTPLATAEMPTATIWWHGRINKLEQLLVKFPWPRAHLCPADRKLGAAPPAVLVAHLGHVHTFYAEHQLLRVLQVLVDSSL